MTSSAPITKKKKLKFADAWRNISGEEYLARKYCAPTAYWHCLHELGPSGMGRYYTFDELNNPQYWLKAVAKYTQQEPSKAARQLHRRVEEARAEFNAKQEKIYGERTLYAISRSREAIYDKEDAAWDTFSAQKQAYLRDYVRAISTGVVKRKNTGQKCKQCNTAKVLGRAQYCDACAKQRQRESLRASRKRKRQSKHLSDISSVLGATQPEGLAKAKSAEKGHLATPIAEGLINCTLTDKNLAHAKALEVGGA